MLFSDANAADVNTTPGATTSAVSTSATAAAPGAGEPSAIGAAMPLILIFVVFYFLLIRPQQKRLRQHDEMVKSLRRGDKVVTGGGVIGTVSKVEDDVLVLEIAPDVKIRVMRDTISHVASKTGVANDNKSDEGK